MEEYSLRSQVFQTIRDDILKGKYDENDELREATLGKELGVSRTPVREALRQLELEGLVNIIPNKGAYVTGISDKDVHDIYMSVGQQNILHRSSWKNWMRSFFYPSIIWIKDIPIS